MVGVRVGLHEIRLKKKTRKLIGAEECVRKVVFIVGYVELNLCWTKIGNEEGEQNVENIFENDIENE